MSDKWSNWNRHATSVAGLVLATAMLGFLPACGGNGTSGMTTESGGSMTSASGDGGSSADGLRSDDSQIVFQDDKSKTKTVFRHEGERITGMSVYVDYGDSQTARATADKLEGDETTTIRVDGTYIVFEYDASHYDGLTLEDVQSDYSHLRQL